MSWFFSPKIVLLLLPALATAEYCMPTNTCWPNASEIRALKFKLSCTGGKLLKPGQFDWPGNNVYNSPLYKAPALIADVITKDQVILSLNFAYKYNIRISIYSTGHDYLGRSLAEGSLQISVKRMKEMKIDLSCQKSRKGSGCMTVGAGVQWAEAYKTTDEVSRMTVGAFITSVGVTGWTLGGGISPFVRKFGLGVQNVLEFHLITSDLSEVWTGPEGTIVKKINGQINSSLDTSLYFALRGGGSSFGVILDMKYQVHADSTIEAIDCVFPLSRDGTMKTMGILVKNFVELMENSPAEFSVSIATFVECSKTNRSCITFVTVSIGHYGTKNSNVEWFKKFENLLSSLANQGVVAGGCTRKTHSNYHAYSLSMPPLSSTGSYYYIGSSLVQKHMYSNETINEIVGHINESYNTFTNVTIALLMLGGAVNDISLHDVPLNKGWKEAIFILLTTTYVLPGDPEKASILTRSKEFHQKLESYSIGTYFNEIEPDLNPTDWKSKAWGLENYLKLVKIKKVWDPQNRFTCHQCVGQDFIRDGNKGKKSFLFMQNVN